MIACGAQDVGRASALALQFPLGVAVGPDGGIFVSERRGHRVLRLDPASGQVITVAGTGEPGFAGDGGPGARARINCPDAIAVDGTGNVYIADRCNERIRRVEGRTGIITTVAGTGERGASDDGPALERSLMGVFYLSVASPGEIIFTDTDSHRIRMLDLGRSRIVTLAGSGEGGYAGDGGPALEARFARPHVAIRLRNGDLLIGDSFNQRIRYVDRTSGIVRTIAGSGVEGVAIDGTPPLEAPFRYFGGAVELPDGDLLVTEWANARVLRIPRGGGPIRVVAGTDREGASPADGQAPLATQFGRLAGLALDLEGRLVVADARHGLIRRIDLTAGTVTTLLGTR